MAIRSLFLEVNTSFTAGLFGGGVLFSFGAALVTFGLAIMVKFKLFMAECQGKMVGFLAENTTNLYRK